jgi:opacity protein-like surface antigen
MFSRRGFEMKKTIMALISASVVFAFASSALAENYFTGKVGIYFPSESDLDNGFNIEGTYGIDASHLFGIDNMTLEFGLGYYKASWDESVPGFKAEVDLTVIPLTATAIYNHEIDSRLSVYGGGGLGLYRAKAEVAGTTSFDFLGEPITETFSDSETKHNIGVQLVGGGRYNLNHQMDLIGELRYVSAGSVEGIDVGGMFLNAGIRYLF